MRLFLLSILFFAHVIASAQTWEELNDLGVEAYNNDQYESAIKHFEKSLPLVKRKLGKKNESYESVLNNLANSYQALNDFENAEIYFLELLKLRKDLIGIYDINYSYTYIELALVNYGMGKLDIAESYYIQAISFCRTAEGNNQMLLTKMLSKLANLYEETGHYVKAEPLYFEASNIVRKELGEDHSDYAICLNNLAALYAKMGKYDEAEIFFLNVIKVWEVRGDTTIDYAAALNNLADLYKAKDRYILAEQMFLKASDIVKMLLGENHEYYAATLINLALLYDEIDQHEKSEEFFLKGNAINKNIFGELHQTYAGGISGLASLYQELGRMAEAEELAIKSASIYKQTVGAMHPDYAFSISVLANLYRTMRLFDKAEPLLIESNSIKKNVFGELHPTYASSLADLASFYQDIKDYEKAEQLYLESNAIIKQTLGGQDDSYARGIHNLGSLYYQMGLNEKAEPLFIESTSIYKKLFGDTSKVYAENLSALAVYYHENGEFSKASPLYFEAVMIRKKLFGENNLDLIDFIGNFAIFSFAIGNKDIAEEIYEQKDILLIKNLKKTFEFTSEKEKVKYMGEMTSKFDLSQSFYYWCHNDMNSGAAGAVNLQLATSGLILDASSELKKIIIAEGGDSLGNIYHQWQEFNFLIAEELSKPKSLRSPDLGQWEEKANLLEKALTRSSLQFKEDRKPFVKWKDIQASLQPKDAAIEFISFKYCNGTFWTDSILYVAVVIRPNDTVPLYVPLFEETQIKGLLEGDSLRTFANLLYTDAQIRNVEHDVSYGDSLYKLTWEPLEPYLVGLNNIYYSPSGLLHNLNFDAIPKNDNSLLSDGSHLNRLTSVSRILDRDSGYYTPTNISLFGGIQYDVDVNTLTKLANDNKRDTQNVDGFVFTRALEDSSASRGGINYLPGSKKEIENIEALFKRNKVSTQSFSGVYATEEAFKNLNLNNSSSILHFSTHGFFFPDPHLKKQDVNQSIFDKEVVFKDSDNPLFRSGLIMAGADYVWKGNEPMKGIEDGILTAYEVSNLYLPNTKLVVMSACETGLGDIGGSEGVYGLQRAFKIAGVDYIIMTLWQVLDKETSDFMTLFYQNLLDKKSIPDAFKTTQDFMKNKYREEPYKWAGFVLIK